MSGDEKDFNELLDSLDESEEMSDDEKDFNKMIDSLDEAIESMDSKLENKEFLELLSKLNQKHPLMHLPDLLNDFMRGDTLQEILNKH